MRSTTTRLSAVMAMLLALVLSLGVAACGGSDDTTGESTSAETGEGGAAIVSNPENGKVSLTIGSKNFAESDRIRDELATMGVVLKDSKDGTTWEIAR